MVKTVVDVAVIAPPGVVIDASVVVKTVVDIVVFCSPGVVLGELVVDAGLTMRTF